MIKQREIKQDFVESFLENYKEKKLKGIFKEFVHQALNKDLSDKEAKTFIKNAFGKVKNMIKAL